MFFGYNPSRKTGRKSNLFSRPEPGTRASIQPIGNPVPAELERIRFAEAELADARARDILEADARANLAEYSANRERLKKDGETARFQALLNANNINPEAFANARKRSQASKMRQAYSSFLSGLG